MFRYKVVGVYPLEWQQQASWMVQTDNSPPSLLGVNTQSYLSLDNLIPRGLFLLTGCTCSGAGHTRSDKKWPSQVREVIQISVFEDLRKPCNKKNGRVNVIFFKGSI